MIEEHAGRMRVVESVVTAAPVERVFAALVTGEELAQWWTEPGVCDDTEWSVDARIGGQWRSRWQWRAGGSSTEGVATRVHFSHR